MKMCDNNSKNNKNKNNNKYENYIPEQREKLHYGY